MTKYLHTMIRVSSLEETIAFFEVLGLREIRRRPDEKGRYTNVFLAAPGDEAAAIELTYNWDPQPYPGGRNFGHLAYAVDNIYDTCNAFVARGVNASAHHASARCLGEDAIQRACGVQPASG